MGSISGSSAVTSICTSPSTAPEPLASESDLAASSSPVPSSSAEPAPLRLRAERFCEGLAADEARCLALPVATVDLPTAGSSSSLLGSSGEVSSRNEWTSELTEPSRSLHPRWERLLVCVDVARVLRHRSTALDVVLWRSESAYEWTFEPVVTIRRRLPRLPAQTACVAISMASDVAQLASHHHHHRCLGRHYQHLPQESQRATGRKLAQDPEPKDWCP